MIHTDSLNSIWACLVCNMPTTVGGTPRLADSSVVPKYPGPLPGGVRPGLTVEFRGLSKDSVDMYSRSEAETMLSKAVGTMFSLRGTAQDLMGMKVSPAGEATYGPEFRYAGTHV